MSAPPEAGELRSALAEFQRAPTPERARRIRLLVRERSDARLEELRLRATLLELCHAAADDPHPPL